MKKQTGFSLLEVLVAIAITTIIIGAALSALDDATRANEAVTQIADLTDNLRAGMNFMVEDLIQAGTGIPTGGIFIPSGAAGRPITRPSPPAAAYTFPAGATAMAAITTGNGLGPISLGPTDIITILYSDNTLPLNQRPINDPNPPIGAPCNGSIAPSASFIVIDPNPECSPDINAADIGLKPGDLIMFSNSNGNALQVITGVVGQEVNFTTGDPFNLNERTDPTGTVRALKSGGNYPPTSITRIWMISYYLDTVTDPQHTRLVRQVNMNPGRPVAEVIENLQITYNFVDGVTNPSNQKDVPACVTPPNCLSQNQIRAVNLFLAARSDVPYSRTGQYFRNNLATQVSLRSMAYVNRYQ